MDEKYVYLIGSINKSVYKIGNTKNISSRLKAIQTGCPYKVEVIHKFKTANANKVEKTLHRGYSVYKKQFDDGDLSGEWFDLSLENVHSFMEECNKIDKNINYLRDNSNINIDKIF